MSGESRIEPLHDSDPKEKTEIEKAFFPILQQLTIVAIVTETTTLPTSNNNTNNTTNKTVTMCNDCTPNKHPLVITAQIFSIVAFCFSFGWIWTFLVGLCAMVVQQLLWCAPVHQNIFWLLAAASLAAAGMNVFAAVEMMRTTTPDFCWPIFTIELMCDDARTFYGILHWVSSGFWLLSAILDVVFVTQKRNENDSGKSNVDDDDEVVVTMEVPVPRTPEDKLSVV